jgi:hypothetical protein
MAAHFSKLESIDDSNHSLSFYSQATMLEGIRCMVELAKDPQVLENLSAPQMIWLFNIVGVATAGPIGGFPDLMTYHLNKILYGANVSVADITMALDLGGKLIALGRTDAIITAVPFFEDRRVQNFLQLYAQLSLEYIASVGMHQMIAEVPKKYPYTICAGIWKMVEVLNRGKTEIAIKLFARLVSSYDNAIEGYFDHILPLLKDNQDPNLSYYLGHNGMTNKIAPILHLVRTKHAEHLSRVLRALYSFEAYQVMHRLTRKDGLTCHHHILDEILGVHFGADRATPLSPMLTRTEPIHSSKAVVNQGAASKYTKSLWFVHYATLLQPMFEALVHSGQENYVMSMQQIPAMTTKSISNALDLPMALDDFMLFNIVEGLLSGDKQSRIGKHTEKPKFEDLGHSGCGVTMIQDYAGLQYNDNYEV